MLDKYKELYVLKQTNIFTIKFSKVTEGSWNTSDTVKFWGLCMYMIRL
jgi:hypothetical protein